MTTVRPPAPTRRTVERAPLRAALVLLALYIAMVLAVTAVAHVLLPTEPAQSLARQVATAELDALAQEAPHAQAD